MNQQKQHHSLEVFPTLGTIVRGRPTIPDPDPPTEQELEEIEHNQQLNEGTYPELDCKGCDFVCPECM